MIDCFRACLLQPKYFALAIYRTVELRKILTNAANHVQSGNWDFVSITSISCLATSRSVTEMACCEFCSAQAKSSKISVRAYAPWQNTTPAQKNDFPGNVCAAMKRALSAMETGQWVSLLVVHSEVILKVHFPLFVLLLLNVHYFMWEGHCRKDQMK